MKKMTSIAIAVLSVITIGCQTIAPQSSTPTTDGVRKVNQVAWDKTGDTFRLPNDNELNRNEARLVFVRNLDDDAIETSTNIGIDGRFQVSLQGQRYSEVVTCSGSHQLSAHITGEKNNQLLDDGQRYDFDGQQTYYFLIDVNDANQPTIRPLTQQQALSSLKDSAKQTHQISRVIADCPVQQPVNQPPVIEPPIESPVIVPATKPETTEVNKPIKLDVLFDFDSATIRPGYYPRLESVAKFMTVNTDTTAALEGHTDNKGPASYNLRLSQNRANAVKDVLVNKYGLNHNRLTTVGYGESQPVDTNDTPEGRQNNRRVIATISQD